ncbi:hypothetical protein IB642_04255 [Allofrancisella guangzhouensis]|uniref:Uncharacterized protein n=1 Tax=Allofrancisella guangzhouensis TaxID=594679 RepID=A0A0A8E968_9GAMM|nr:YiiX/YebB-like N1pC/P60 family cysteine hydrolase [Allofrancisella guangzhouensis]AJC48701.1 hypothetical protein SD28_03110 [Allofrancisella guangzhouensis]MBK2026949.1 hypothetical protein [Allofrancisella guangzhouensis]MBK2044231.1 hypothetical protein [Allofrancisella guangzhouensis]MBK2045163.1 hypothetical protein [Allofrancisella guangzhouensis]
MSSSHQRLKKGDVLFIVDSAEKNISNLSIGYENYSYYHCSLYIGNNEIIESIKGDGVITADLSKYSNNKILTGRTSQNDDFLNEVIKYAQDLIGCQYNDLFLPKQPGKFYCSELIHEIFKYVNKETFFKQHRLNYISPNDFSVSQYWLDFYSQYGLKVPQGQIGSHPNNLSLDEKFRYRFWF